MKTLEKCETCSELTISYHLMLLLLALNILHTFFNVSIVDFEQVHVSWVVCIQRIVKHQMIGISKSF